MRKLTLIIIGILLMGAGVYGTRLAFAEQSENSPESGAGSRIKSAYDELVTLGYGSDSAGSWGNWGSMWNRIRSAGEWAPDGTLTADKVLAGETFYSDSRDKQTGTLSLSGDAVTGDVFLGKTFYSDSFEKLTGTWSFSGDATAADVVSGKTFYSNSSTLLTGSAPAPIDYSLLQFNDFSCYEGSEGNSEEYQDDEPVWTNTSPNVWRDERTELYWSNARSVSITNLFPNQDHSTCDFFSANPRSDYNGTDVDCGNSINLCATLLLDKNGDSISDMDWYLPSNKELLMALIDGMYNQTTSDFTTALYFWSSTEDASSSSHAWNVNFNMGYTNESLKSTSGSWLGVRCVSRD